MTDLSAHGNDANEPHDAPNHPTGCGEHARSAGRPVSLTQHMHAGVTRNDSWGEVVRAILGVPAITNAVNINEPTRIDTGDTGDTDPPSRATIRLPVRACREIGVHNV